jgi:hypothetical protein
LRWAPFVREGFVCKGADNGKPLMSEPADDDEWAVSEPGMGFEVRLSGPGDAQVERAREMAPVEHTLGGDCLIKA